MSDVCVFLFGAFSRTNPFSPLTNWSSAFTGMIVYPSDRMYAANSTPDRLSSYGAPGPERAYSSTSRRVGDSSPIISSSMRHTESPRMEKQQSRCMRS